MTENEKKGHLTTEDERDNLAAKYSHLEKFCRNYNRPFSVLDLGPEEGYFTSRLSNDFDGVFTAIVSSEYDSLLTLQTKNKWGKKGDIDKNLILKEKINSESLTRIANVHYFDIVLVFGGMWELPKEYLDIIMGMTSYCFVEHTDKKIHVFEGEEDNKIKKRWSGGTFYEEGDGITIKSSFDDISVEYKHREENRPWDLGMNLRLFLECGGIYPTHDKIFEMIDEMEVVGDKIDLGPANLILNNGKINLIDQNDHTDLIVDKEALKEYLMNGQQIPNMSPFLEIND